MRSSEEKLLPSSHLNVKVSNTQISLLNPTSRDVQIGAVMEACSGAKAKKRIAKRRTDVVTGNINSYARVCNGPDQLKQLQQYKELTSSLSALAAEKQELVELARKKKMKEGKDKEARKAEKARKAKEEKEQSLPIVKELVSRGLLHCLSQVVPMKIKILKYQFNHPEAKSSLKLNRADKLLTDCFAAMHDEPTSLSVNKSVGIPPLLSLDSDSHINGDEYFV